MGTGAIMLFILDRGMFVFAPQAAGSTKTGLAHWFALTVAARDKVSEMASFMVFLCRITEGEQEKASEYDSELHWALPALATTLNYTPVGTANRRLTLDRTAPPWSSLSQCLKMRMQHLRLLDNDTRKENFAMILTRTDANHCKKCCGEWLER